MRHMAHRLLLPQQAIRQANGIHLVSSGVCSHHRHSGDSISYIHMHAGIIYKSMRAIKRLPVLLLATIGAAWLLHWMFTSDIQKHSGIFFLVFVFLLIFVVYRMVLRWVFVDYCKWLRTMSDERKSTIIKTKIKPLPKQ